MHGIGPATGSSRQVYKRSEAHGRFGGCTMAAQGCACHHVRMTHPHRTKVASVTSSHCQRTELGLAAAPCQRSNCIMIPRLMAGQCMIKTTLRERLRCALQSPRLLATSRGDGTAAVGDSWSPGPPGSRAGPEMTSPTGSSQTQRFILAHSKHRAMSSVTSNWYFWIWIFFIGGYVAFHYRYRIMEQCGCRDAGVPANEPP